MGRAKYHEDFNHAIAIRYYDREITYAPPHQDKVEADTSFVVLSYHNSAPRTFRILETRDPKGKVVWQMPLAHGSLLRVSGPANQKYYHDAPQDKNWSGVRYSLIFRTIRARVDDVQPRR